MSRGIPLRWAEEAEADEKLMRGLPRRPGERAVRDADVTGEGALRFSSKFTKTLEQTQSSKGKSGGGGGKQRAQQSWGQDMQQARFTAAQARCCACALSA
jgi:hypothetical protein